MKKLVNGIVEFRNNIQPAYREKFARLALGQSPDTLFFACSDSRVVPNLFASTDPGDLFVIRNVGNLIPACGEEGHSSADESEAAAIEFALVKLNVSNIIVCGHSECGAMNALLAGRENIEAPNLKAWLRHADLSLERIKTNQKDWPKHNHLSQENVLQQISHLRSYPVVKDRENAGKLRLHAWWFEIKTANVWAYEEDVGKFVVIDEAEADKILSRL
jgi:carbonic anhydrase